MLEVSEPKLLLWLRRAKVQQDRAQAAPKPARSGRLRDSEPEIIWRMCCLMQHAITAMKTALTEVRLVAVLEEFCTGDLDKYIYCEATVLRADFTIGDLGFLRTSDSCQEISMPGDQVTSRPGADEAEFKFAMARLKMEQVKWRSYLKARQDIGTETLADAKMHQSKIQAFCKAKAAGLVEQFYMVKPRKDLNSAALFFSSRRHAAAGQEETVEACWRVDWWSLPALGKKSSLKVDDMGRLMSQAAADCPGTWCALVIAPNQPQWHKGDKLGGHRADAEVEAHCQQLAASLGLAPGLLIRPCCLHLEEKGFYSPDRALKAQLTNNCCVFLVFV